MRATLALALASLGACEGHPPPKAAPWTELFDGHTLGDFVAGEFGGDGSVRVVDGAIQLGIGSPLTGVTWRGPPPRGEYELEVTARRIDGVDFFCGLTFPVGDAHLTLILGGWGGAVCGLSSLDGDDASSNATRTLRHFENGRDYVVRLRVTRDRVTVTVDRKPFLAADLAGRRLSLRPEVELSRPLGICAFATEAAVRAVRWRALPAR